MANYYNSLLKILFLALQDYLNDDYPDIETLKNVSEIISFFNKKVI